MAGRTKPAFELAVGAISRRERTEAELRAWLHERCDDAEEVEDAVLRLVELGSVDDERYARLFTEDKRELSGWGPDRIRESLVERGISRALAEAATGGESHDEQLERAAALLRKRGGVGDDNADRSRALAFLARRGFEAEVAYGAIRRACESARSPLA